MAYIKVDRLQKNLEIKSKNNVSYASNFSHF